MTGDQCGVWKLLFLNLISHFNLIFSLTSNSMLWTATFGAVAMPFIFGVVGSLRFIYLPICFPAVPVYIEVNRIRYLEFYSKNILGGGQAAVSAGRAAAAGGGRGAADQDDQAAGPGRGYLHLQHASSQQLTLCSHITVFTIFKFK